MRLTCGQGQRPALLFGTAMLAAKHPVTLTWLHLEWNWTSVLRSS
jgi:hypothetical protein